MSVLSTFPASLNVASRTGRTERVNENSTNCARYSPTPNSASVHSSTAVSSTLPAMPAKVNGEATQSNADASSGCDRASFRSGSDPRRDIWDAAAE
eukprot:4023216-Prymnesium_polylepis.1